MGLLDQLKTADDGVKPAGRPAGNSWRPAKDRTVPDGIEGRIVTVDKRPIAMQNRRENGPTEDTVITVTATGGGEDWVVYGSTRDLRDRFAALEADGLLVVGNTVAIKFFGTRNEKANDGTPYSVHSYAVAVEKARDEPGF